MTNTYKKQVLIVSLILNVSNLVYFNYSNFFIKNFNAMSGQSLPLLTIAMPLALSFYTFQGMSYVMDSYRNPELIERNFLNYSLYILMFAQLIAGPIVRYGQVMEQLDARTHSIDKLSSGINRFVLGLGKKVLISNTFALIADNIFKLGNGLDNSSLAWMGGIAYTLQIYFDFSGYSDMAIGLGRMFGFEFLENFNYPYIAKSVTDFWRRWHMSLSSWFRDYVYIPLGGNRVNKARQIVNIFVVWGLTGFWHGASWNFMIWGLYYGAILVIEKNFLWAFLQKHKVFGHLYTLLIVVVGWVLFRANSLEQVWHYVGTMFRFQGGLHKDVVYYLVQYKFQFLAAVVFSTPILRKVKRTRLTEMLLTIALPVVLILVVMTLLQSSYNPFIYMKF